MDGAPRFDSEELFDPRRVRLADIDGTGTADLLYVGADGVTAWFNQSGNGWSAPTLVGRLPERRRAEHGPGDRPARHRHGLPGLVLAAARRSPPSPLRYVDLMGGSKPHLLIRARNNLGAETRVSYAPSTRFYVADEARRPPVGDPAALPRAGGRARRDDRLDRPQPPGHPLRLPPRLLRRLRARVPRLRPGRAVGHRGVPRRHRVRRRRLRELGPASWSPPVLTRTWFHTGAFEQAGAVASST